MSYQILDRIAHATGSPAAFTRVGDKIGIVWRERTIPMTQQEMRDLIYTPDADLGRHLESLPSVQPHREPADRPTVGRF